VVESELRGRSGGLTREEEGKWENERKGVVGVSGSAEFNCGSERSN